MSTTKVPASRMISYDTGSFCFRNKIINGDMRIDQRNSGTAVSVNGIANVFSTDRWFHGSGATPVTSLSGTAQQVSDAPPGFTKSIRWVTTQAKPVLASNDNAWIVQFIEGQNLTDLAYGTSSSKTTTISFWVKSSVTGNFTFTLRPQQGTGVGTSYRCYTTTYTVSNANTWEYKQIIIPGDTLLSFNTNTSAGICVYFDLGAGSAFQTSLQNTWQSGNLISITGNTQVANTQGATFQITGVQFEVGPVATPFEFRPIGTELALCQRYFYKLGQPRNGSIGARYLQMVAGTVDLNQLAVNYKFPVTMRTAPVLFLGYTYDVNNNLRSDWNVLVGNASEESFAWILYNTTGAGGINFTAGKQYWMDGFTANAEL